MRYGPISSAPRITAASNQAQLNKLQLRQMRLDLATKQFERAQRVGKRHGAEKKIGEQIIDSELAGLPIELGANRRRRAGYDGAILDAGFEIRAARHVKARSKASFAVLDAQPI